MRYVLDSSVAFKWVIPEVHSDKALRLRAAFQAGIHELVSLDIFPGEVGHALTRAERQRRITIGEALRLWSAVMTRSPHIVASLPVTHRAIAISSQTRIGVFDCMYGALSEREGCEMVTADTRLISNLQPLFPVIKDLADFP
jgi:predicted nucleic acid-binding protein